MNPFQDTILPPYAAGGFVKESEPVFDENDYTDIKYRDLIGKRVILTGGSSGIGREVAKKLLQAGAFVILLGRQVQVLEKLRDYPKSKGSIRVFECNLEDPE